MSYLYNDLKNVPLDELIKEYDEHAKRTVVGIDYYAREIDRRQTEHSNRIMVNCTIAIAIMTLVMTIATVINVCLFVR